MEALASDWAAAPISDRLRAILGYAVRLTERPGSIGRDDVGRLRAAGLDDREILDVAQVTAYFNFVNRLADGLGVELEP